MSKVIYVAERARYEIQTRLLGTINWVHYMSYDELDTAISEADRLVNSSNDEFRVIDTRPDEGEGYGEGDLPEGGEETEVHGTPDIED